MKKKKLRILTYNIHKGFNSLKTEFILSRIKQSLLETKADILFLQEVEGLSTRSKAPSQFEYLADVVWPHYSYGKNAVFSQRHHGNAILSKFPIIFEENMNISTNMFEQRGLLHCIIEIPDLKKEVHLFNTHMDLLSGGRKKQILKIKNRIKSHTQPKDALIFTGDFNDWSQEIHMLLDEPFLGLKEAHTQIHGQPAKTFPSFMPLLPLDRVYYKGMTPISSRSLSFRPWNKLSDHIPLLIDFEI